MGSEFIAGVVVGHVDYGESDRIVRLLTASEGRISLLARSARSSKKRFGGVLDLGTRIRVRRARGRGRLVRISEVELVAAVNRARTDIDRIALLAYGCELVGRLAGEDVPAPKLARLLVVWVELLEGESLPGVASRQSLEAKALTFTGVLPSLTHCAACSRPLEGPVVVAHETGAMHGHCGTGQSTSADALRSLEALRRTPLFNTPKREPSSAGWLLSDLAQHQIRAAIKSRVLLADLQS